VEAEALLQIHPYIFSHRTKQCVLPLSAVTVSLDHLPKMQEVNSHMWKNASTIVTSIEPLNIRCHVIVAQQRATADQRARKFCHMSLQAKKWTWVNCKRITASH